MDTSCLNVLEDWTLFAFNKIRLFISVPRSDQMPRDSWQLLLSRTFKSEFETAVVYSAVLLAPVFTDRYQPRAKTKHEYYSSTDAGFRANSVEIDL